MSLAELRKPFPPSKVGKLPRITCQACSKKQCNDQAHKPKPCKECGNYITPKHIHLDYVGHAEVTRRLLEVDPMWTWEPMAYTETGLPALDSSGGLWIKLTIHDQDGTAVTRPGWGDATSRNGGMKEVIGDAIRNGAMRFGVALDLWSKEKDEYIETEGTPPPPPAPPKPYSEWLAAIVASCDRAELMKVGQEMATADIADGERVDLRAEFTKRMQELK